MNQEESKLYNFLKQEIDQSDEIDNLTQKIEKISISCDHSLSTKKSKNKKLLCYNGRRTQLISDIFEIKTTDAADSLESNRNCKNINDILIDDTFFSTVPVSDSEISENENLDIEKKKEPPHSLVLGWNWNSEKFQYYLCGNTGRIKRNLYISPKVYFKLKDHPYQYDGIRWMWKRMKRSEGGILADEMGLGKTIQVCVFIGALFRSEIANFILLILPASLINQWEDELENWCPKIPKFIYHGSSAFREEALNNLYRSKIGGVLITTFETFRNDIQKLCSIELSKISCNYIRNKDGFKVLTEDYIKSINQEDKEEIFIPWDISVIDEAHKLKNSNTKLFKNIQTLKSYCNILCTGTPIQNKLTELWSLIQCVKPNLLGKSIRVFNYNYVKHINKLNYSDSSKKEIEFSELIIRKLKTNIKPYILRRNKKIVSDIYYKNQEIAYKKNLHISDINKFDIVLWHNLSLDQSRAYLEVLDSHLIKRILNEKFLSSKKDTGDILKAITLLLKICKHPLFLLNTEFQSWRMLLEKKNELNNEIFEDIDINLSSNEKPEYSFNSVLKLSQLNIELLREQSAKLQILFIIVPHLAKSNKKILIFTESLLMMDMIELTILIPNNISWERLEGKQTLEERKKNINSFKNNDEKKVLLLSKHVGSTGLNLTVANRIVIVEPHWNPTQDEQAIGRAYRIGQRNDVIVYRLVSVGTIEDWKFRLQLHKTGLAKTLLGERKQETMFSSEELNYLFSYSEFGTNEIQEAIIRYSAENKYHKILEEDITTANIDNLEPFIVAYLDFENIRKYE